MNARLTIAIPTYNRASLLKRALESALAQTSERVEILVSDNGSSDETNSIINSYNDPRLKKVRHEKTMSRAEHGTFIYNTVKTELITPLSDDDWLEPDFASEVIKLYELHPEISFCYTGCFEHYYDTKIPAITGPELESPKDFFMNLYAGKRNVSWCACAMRLSDILALVPQPENIIMGDMYFWTQIGHKGNIGCVNKMLSNYTILRDGGESHSQSVPIKEWGEESINTAYTVIEKLRPDLSRKELDELTDNAKIYAALSTASRFLFSRLYGMSAINCIKESFISFDFASRDIKALPRLKALIRVVAACTLPKSAIRFIIVNQIRIRAKNRSKK